MDTAVQRNKSLYRQDERAWKPQQAELPWCRDLSLLDRENLQTYLERMSGGARRELRGRLKALLPRMLKPRCRPDKHSLGWKRSIEDQSDEIEAMSRAEPAP